MCQLLHYDLIRVSEPDEPPCYAAFPEGFLDSVIEFATASRKMAAEKAARRARSKRKRG